MRCVSVWYNNKYTLLIMVRSKQTYYGSCFVASYYATIEKSWPIHYKKGPSNFSDMGPWGPYLFIPRKYPGHCYGRGKHLHRDATSITADFNLFLLCQPSFNVPILLLWVVKTYIQLPFAVWTIGVSNMQIYFYSKYFYWWTCSAGCTFFNTYRAWTLSVRIHTLSLLLSAQIIHGFTLKYILHNLVSKLAISDMKIKLLVI